MSFQSIMNQLTLFPLLGDAAGPVQLSLLHEPTEQAVLLRSAKLEPSLQSVALIYRMYRSQGYTQSQSAQLVCQWFDIAQTDWLESTLHKIELDPVLAMHPPVAAYTAPRLPESYVQIQSSSSHWDLGTLVIYTLPIAGLVAVLLIGLLWGSR